MNNNLKNIIGKTAQWNGFEFYAEQDQINKDCVQLNIYLGKEFKESCLVISKEEIVADSLNKKHIIARYAGNLKGDILSPRTIAKTNAKGKTTKATGMNRISMIDKFIESFK